VRFALIAILCVHLGGCNLNPRPDDPSLSADNTGNPYGPQLGAGGSVAVVAAIPDASTKHHEPRDGGADAHDGAAR
jgi:hypothetical protein